MNKFITINLSWPYANGEMHIGHAGSSLPADAVARYHRLKGNNVAFVSGSDCFGTPTLLKAKELNLTPEQVTTHYHKLFVESFKKLDFSFDNYTLTNNPYHINFVQDFYRKMLARPYMQEKIDKQLFCENCNRFLPDRYVVGICPFCKNEAKGDSCDHCGKMLEPEILLEPKCKICGQTPVLKDCKQKYLMLSKLQNEIKENFEAKKEHWTLSAIGLTERYINEGLQDRAMTRYIEWGIPLPVEGDPRKIYVWGEDVLGYASACKFYCEQNNLNFDDFWKNKDAVHYYFHGKDNVPFHSIVLPGLLLANGEGYHLPDRLISSEYVNLEGEKISKSKGNIIKTSDFVDYFGSEFTRYYFLRYINDKKDVNFTFLDFTNTINGELINNYGNFVNRTLSFIKSKLNSVVKLDKISTEVDDAIKNTFDKVDKLYEDGYVSSAVKEIMELVSFANKYFDTTAPWNTIKTDLELCNRQCLEYLTLIANISIMLQPIIPKSANKVICWLSIENSFIKYNFKSDIHLKDFERLFDRIDFDVVKKDFSQFIK